MLLLIFFTADTHFSHDKIAKLRGLNSPEDMNIFIVDKWNSQVTDKDIVFHLGDVCLGKTEVSVPTLKKLNGKKYLVPGNHDHSNRVKILTDFFELLPLIHRLKSKTIRCFLGRDVACGAFLCHYPMLDWGQPVWHLHGHFHGDKLPYTPVGAITKCCERGRHNY